MIDCPKFVEMWKMFHGNYVTITEVQPIAKTQIIIVDVNVVDVNVTTRNKVTEKHVFNNRKPRKVKSVANLEKEEWLK
jgi:hypothetical protein